MATFKHILVEQPREGEVVTIRIKGGAQFDAMYSHFDEENKTGIFVSNMLPVTADLWRPLSES